MTVPVSSSSRPCPGFTDGWVDRADRPALITVRGVIGYRQLDDLVTAEEELLGARGRLVLIELRNTVAAVVSYLAALRAGHAVIIAPDARARESLCEIYDPDIVVESSACGGSRVVQRRRGTRHDLHPDLALLMPTSGSTGSAKLVRLSYENLDSNANAIADSLGIKDTDRAMTSLPLSYCYGLSILHSHLARGAAVIVTGQSVVDPEFWDLATTAGATSFAGVPYTFELLDRTGFADLDLPSLRYITQAGGKMAADRVQRYAELGRSHGWDLVVMYGQTEATARMALLPADRVLDAPQAVGVPIPDGRFTIKDDGELVYHGPNVMLGYAESIQDLALGRVVDRLCTGDLGRRRADGLYEIVGRRSRFLKLFGLRIDLDQIEHELLCDGIEALCTGDDNRLVVAAKAAGADPSAVVCAKTGLPAAVVHTFVVEELPRNANGKADYAAVLRAVRSPRAQQSPSAAKSEDVRAIYREILKVDQIDDAATFVSLGGDSLSYVEASQRLERRLGPLPRDWHLLSVADLQARRCDRSRGPIGWMDTSTVLRAVAIVMVCANHVGLIHVWGGAHVLLAVSGSSFARFQLNAVASSGRVRPLLGSIARIAVPSVAVIAFAYVITRDYELWNVLLLGHVVGPVGEDLGRDGWDPVWNYWFIEVLVAILIVCAALLSIPAIRRLERAWSFGFALAFLAVSLVLRFHVLVGEVAMEPYRPHMTVWLFAIGWAAARATRLGHRALLTGAALCATLLPGFFDDDHGRKVVILGGLLLLIWLARVPIPVGLQRVTAVLAGGSLWIYLTQPQTFFMLEWGQSLFAGPPAAAGSDSGPATGQSGPLYDARLIAATVIALVVGVVAWKAYERAVRYLVRHRANRGDPSRGEGRSWPLLDRDRLGEVARFVDVIALRPRQRRGKDLQRDG